MRKKLLWVSVLALAQIGIAQTNDVADLARVVVWAERLRPAAVHETALALAPSGALTVRGQGEAGTLQDLSVNGSAFSEAGLVFNGATVRNAQTEHFNADLPASADWMTTPRVLTGLDLFRASSGHSAGSLSVTLNDRPTRGGRATLGAGLDGLVFGRTSALETFDIGETGFFFVGAFAEAARADKIDGYESNPMSRAQTGARVGFGAADWTFDALVSWQWRDFGCTGAYGANEKYPAWEEDETALASAVWRYDAGDDQKSEISLLWSRARDAYWLFRDKPDFYENTHRADSVTLHGATRRHFTDLAFIDLRGDADAEIYETTHHNNDTGKSPRTKHEAFRRFHGAVAAIPGVRLGDTELALGAAGEFFSAYSAQCAPAGGITYFLSDEQKIALSYREGLRMPSYTELTYDSPDSKGTIDLPLQRTRSANLDWTIENVARVGAFVMRSEDLVDWIRTQKGANWKATALKPVTSFGISGEATWKATKTVTLAPRGAFILKETASDYEASRYALDYPVASFSVEATWQILDAWRLSYRQGVELWKENPIRRSSRVRNISSFETVVEIPHIEGLELALGLSDLFDQAFEVYPGQRAAGLNGFLALTYRW